MVAYVTVACGGNCTVLYIIDSRLIDWMGFFFSSYSVALPLVLKDDIYYVGIRFLHPYLALVSGVLFLL